MRSRSLLLLLLALTLLYNLGQQFWYSGTPLGISPVLDGQENLQRAQAWAQGTTPAEPLYRAPLYPWLLSTAYSLGIPDKLIPLLSRLANTLLHLGTALLLFAISQSIWQKRRAALLAMALYGLYPIAIHFSGDPLDTTLALLLFTLSLYHFIQYSQQGHHLRHCLLCGLAIGLAIITRPHFLTVALVYPLLYLWQAPSPSKKILHLVSYATAPTLCLLLFGLINQQRSQQFLLLPTQGAYNLWAANQSSANGRYYTQHTTLTTQKAFLNPTQAEADILYKQAHHIPLNQHIPQYQQNHYWRSQFWQQLRQQPDQFIQHLARKLTDLISNTEYYNNKTYAFHKNLSPWLRLNPLCFALLLALASYSLVLHYQNKALPSLALILITYAAGTLLFFISSRFKLPIVIPLILIGSGALTYKTLKPTLIALAASTTLLLTSLLLSDPADTQKTQVSDKTLLASAALSIGQDAQAHYWAQQALQQNPQLIAAQEIALLSQFNQDWLALPQLPSPSSIQEALDLAQHLNHFSSGTTLATATYLILNQQALQAKQALEQNPHHAPLHLQLLQLLQQPQHSIDPQLPPHTQTALHTLQQQIQKSL